MTMNKENNINLFAFWEYDLYPYMLGGVASKINDNGRVYVDSYQSWFKPVSLLPVKAGKEMMRVLNAMAEDYHAAENKLKKEHLAKLLMIFAFHPKHGKI